MIKAIEALKNSGKVTVDEDHDWGYQLRFVNEDEYCGKFLVLTNNSRSSFHYHKLKKETFIVLTGHIYLDVSRFDNNWTKWKTIFNGKLHPGDIQTINHHERHVMHKIGIAPCVILEVSTHDDDGDTYRIEEET